ncbi:MAG: hypothetical protein ACOYWZ_21485 [Bacillota bacterium]
MVCDDTKRVVVIRNIPSNVVEEVILVLKNRPDGAGKSLKNILSKDAKKTNEHILKEAEEIINNYIKSKKAQSEQGIHLNLRPYRPKAKLFTNMAINLALVGSIALLIFMVTRFF